MVDVNLEKTSVFVVGSLARMMRNRAMNVSTFEVNSTKPSLTTGTLEEAEEAESMAAPAGSAAGGGGGGRRS